MSEDQFKRFLEDNRTSTAAAIEKATEKYVNGGIRDLRKILDNHIVRVEPVVKAYEDEKAFNIGVKKLGDTTIYWSQVVGAVGICMAAFYYVLTHFGRP